LDYTSHNTKQLDTKEVIDICKNLKYVKDQLNE